MTQPSLDFNVLPTPRAAKRQRDKAIEKIDPSFIEAASARALQLLEMGGPMSGEHLTIAVKALGIVPRDDRQFGAVYLSLSRKGLIERVGFCKRLRGNSTQGGSIWAKSGRVGE